MNESKRQKPVMMSVTALRKSFAEVEVLHGIDLEIRAGEVHAILGENGAGKSTLVKILSGFESRSSGDMLLNKGDKLSAIDSWDNETAEDAGVILIHQEFNLAEQLSVSENIFLGNEIRRGLFLDKKQMRAQSVEYLSKLNSDVSPDNKIHDLAVSAKQMVELAKAQAKHARLLILDEPTAVLTQQESKVLFELIENLKQQGVAIVYISHKLDEIEQIADTITVLRDGELIGVYPAQELSKDDMVRLMVGRELTSLFPEIPLPADDVQQALAVEQLALPGVAAPISFSLKKGEVLGFSGLVGSGRTALLETVVGLRKPASLNAGKITLNGRQVKLNHPSESRELGIAYLTKDRKGSGLLLDKDLSMNFSLFALRKFSSFLLDTKKEQQAFSDAVDTFDIRMKDNKVTAGKLSGGNQQKLLLAKVMEAEPAVIIIDEPTRGIDIGTKSQIYHFIAELVASGHSIILISSDITEIIGMSHRVVVMYRGEISGVLQGREIEEEEIMRYATGLKTKRNANEKLENEQKMDVG